MAGQYFKMVNDWFQMNREPIEEALEKANSHLTLVGREAEEGCIPPPEAIEVGNYYKYFISAKLKRALRGKDEDKRLDFDFDGIPKDSDGSAKIALIAMDRSISAWGVIASYLPGRKSSLAQIVARLKQIRDITEKEFPEARAFVRPGFDQV